MARLAGAEFAVVLADLDPLGMRDTSFDFAVGMRGNWAKPHGLDVDGRSYIDGLSGVFTVAVGHNNRIIIGPFYQ